MDLFDRRRVYAGEVGFDIGTGIELETLAKKRENSRHDIGMSVVNRDSGSRRKSKSTTFERVDNWKPIKSEDHVSISSTATKYFRGP